MSTIQSNSSGLIPLIKGKRAIIAEDQGVIQLQLGRTLKSAGINVVGTASNGLDAVNLVTSLMPDIVLMDMQMPEMDGLDAARRILAEMRMCIIMLTAYPDMEHLQEAAEVGIAGYIVKPITSEDLIPQIEELYGLYINQSLPTT